MAFGLALVLESYEMVPMMLLALLIKQKLLILIAISKTKWLAIQLFCYKRKSQVLYNFSVL